MPLTDHEQRLLRRESPGPCNLQMFLVYLNVLFDRPSYHRLTLDDPDVQALLGWRAPRIPFVHTIKNR